MNWTLPQIIASAVSIIALTLSIANLAIAGIKSRREDFLRIDQLLDSAFNHLYGSEGYSKTKDAKKLSDAEVAVAHHSHVRERAPDLLTHLDLEALHDGHTEEQNEHTRCDDDHRKHRNTAGEHVLAGEKGFVLHATLRGPAVDAPT